MSIEELKCRFGFREPDRGLDKEDVDHVIWRFGKMPDYTMANTTFLLGKTQNHKAGKYNLYRVFEGGNPTKEI